MMKLKVARGQGDFSAVTQMSREDFDSMLAIGRKEASDLFGIARP